MTQAPSKPDATSPETPEIKKPETSSTETPKKTFKKFPLFLKIALLLGMFGVALYMSKNKGHPDNFFEKIQLLKPETPEQNTSTPIASDASKMLSESIPTPATNDSQTPPPKIEKEIKQAPSQSAESEEKASILEVPQSPTYALSEADYRTRLEAISALNRRIYHGHRYLDELITVKTFFPDLPLDTMGLYATTGVHDNFYLSDLGKKALKQASLLPLATSIDATVCEKIMSYLKRLVVVVPPTSDSQSLQGQFGLLRQMLQQGKLQQANLLVQQFPEKHRQFFADFSKMVQDKHNIKQEMRALDEALSKALFPPK